MIFSAQQTFSDKQNLTATGVSTNVIDLQATGTVLNAPAALKRDIGKGTPIPIVIQLTADAGGTSPTLDAVLQGSTDEAFTSPVELAAAPQLVGGVAGDQAKLFYVPEGADLRYIRVSYTLAGTSPDYTVTAGIVAGDQSNDSVAGV